MPRPDLTTYRLTQEESWLNLELAIVTSIDLPILVEPLPPLSMHIFFLDSHESLNVFILLSFLFFWVKR